MKLPVATIAAMSIAAGFALWPQAALQAQQAGGRGDGREEVLA